MCEDATAVQDDYLFDARAGAYSIQVWGGSREGIT